MGGREEEQLPAGMPWWCRVLSVVPVAAAGLALLGSDGRDPFTVLIWAAVTYWVTGALSRWVLVRRGHSQEVARGWVEAGLQASWCSG
ncbi:hypothetical protein WDZ17_15540 [Pseudokineococcus basanitobsidens]|uniref:Uncharacterized protein n=1 Tax=Pseudokineococcus basanitobsidens TaxID=1926649 RepID=A0ABU8RNQ5_9ACTN